MSGIALLFEVGNASAAVGTMLDRMAGAGEVRSVVAFAPGAAIGGTWHAATPGGRAPRRREPELGVAANAGVPKRLSRRASGGTTSREAS